MGSALARGWAGSYRVRVYDPMAAALPDGVERVRAIDPVTGSDALTMVLAVKPQQFAQIADMLRPLAEGGALIVSIMAGITIAGLSDSLGGTGRLVRAMPNTPAAIGKGITAAAAGPGVKDGDTVAVDRLLAPTGTVVWLEEETQFDAVTALSGSGPAYFFRFAEALAKAGTDAGLPGTLAMQLARATFTGAAALADADPEELAALRQQVTSPGGTTAAGLAEMDADGAIDRLAHAIVEAAAARSRALAL